MFDLHIMLNRQLADTTQPINSDDYWRPVLIMAAQEIQGLNQLFGHLLPEPIPSNPEAETIEGYLGIVNTPPTEYGYVTVRLPFRKLIPPHGVSPQSFSFVLGSPIEDGPSGEIWASGNLT